MRSGGRPPNCAGCLLGAFHPCHFITRYFECVGRLLGGFLSDAALHHLRTPRPLAFSVVTALMAVAMLLLLGGTWSLYPAAVLAGVSYGGMNALLPATVSEVFGLPHVPVMYPTISLSFALGSYLFCTLLFSSVFDGAMRRHGLTSGGDCVWIDCFSGSVLVAAASCAVGAALSVLLARITQPRYRELLAPNCEL